ncbi:hypothetical protein HanXRQr2_Chr07g0290161 [Helianthus annuus]|uniref:Uncharacterized protein n=1 Tax=Helianthus annuus TaxID=4232 RepID=A0A9K3IKD5_HELAN|nr:hypothetical protein HanXRQr2_Chr07g0290161 [Helianthus annuus]KAJ0904330.1 hypothetical protein HanPSC8_Chr07g0280871 [Helianthus annuus]
MRIRQHHILNQRRLIGTQPPKIRNKQHRILNPINNLIQRIRILTNKHMIPPIIPLPIKLFLQPHNQLLLCLLITIPLFWRNPIANRVRHQTQRRKKRHIEQISLTRIRNPGHIRPGSFCIIQITKQVPFSCVLITGVFEGCDVIKPLGTSRNFVAFDDAIGES